MDHQAHRVAVSSSKPIWLPVRNVIHMGSVLRVEPFIISIIKTDSGMGPHQSCASLTPDCGNQAYSYTGGQDHCSEGRGQPWGNVLMGTL